MIYGCPGGREKALSLCGCDVPMLLTYCLVTVQPGKPHGVGMAALVLLSRAFGWDVGAAHSGCGCWQREQLGDLWDVAAPEEVCPCRGQILYPAGYT